MLGNVKNWMRHQRKSTAGRDIAPGVGCLSAKDGNNAAVYGSYISKIKHFTNKSGQVTLIAITSTKCTKMMPKSCFDWLSNVLFWQKSVGQKILMHLHNERHKMYKQIWCIHRIYIQRLLYFRRRLYFINQFEWLLDQVSLE